MTWDQRRLFVRVPVPLIDDILPALKDTEVRVLLVVLRQLAVVGHERQTTWLTHSALCRRTGRSSEAVSGAVASLCQNRLIEVRDEGGRVLASAKERQRASGQRYYRLSAPLVAGDNLRFAKSPAEKLKTIDTYYDIYSLRLSKTLTEEQAVRVETEKQRIRERLRRIRESR